MTASMKRINDRASVGAWRARLERAYDLAYFVLADRDAALETALEALTKLPVVATAQDRRLAYVPKGRARAGQARARAFRTRPLHDEAHLLQRLVYVETERFETRQERAGATGESALLLRYVKHLVRITLKRNSFHVVLGVARLLHRYPTAAALDLHALVMQDAARTPEDDYCRARKRQLMAELQARFGARLRVVGAARGEQRFETRTPTPDEVALVEECLRRFTPWDTPCSLPEHFDARLDELPSLAFSGDDPDREHPVETKRMHALLHPDCLRRLARALRLAAPAERVAVPCFTLHPEPPRPNDERPAAPHGSGPPPLTDGDYERAAGRLAVLRESWGRRLRISIDGGVWVALDLASGAPVELGLEDGAELIEVHDEQARLVAVCLLGAGCPTCQHVVADDGGVLTFEIVQGPPRVRIKGRAAWSRRVVWWFASRAARLHSPRALLPVGALLAVLLALIVHWPQRPVASLMRTGEPRASVSAPPALAPSAAPRVPSATRSGDDLLRGTGSSMRRLPEVRALVMHIEAPGAPALETTLRAALVRGLQQHFEWADAAEQADGLLHVRASHGRLHLVLLDPAGRALWRWERPVSDGLAWQRAATDAARALRVASRPAS